MGGLKPAQEAQIQRLQDNLSALRRIAGWTMEDLGSRINVTKQTISNLEHPAQKARMSLTQYVAIRAVLDYEAARRLEADENDTLLALAIEKVLDEDLDEEECQTVEGDVALIAAAVAGKAPDEAVKKLADEKIGRKAKMSTAAMAAAMAAVASAGIAPAILTPSLFLSLGMFGWMGRLFSPEDTQEEQKSIDCGNELDSINK